MEYPTQLELATPDGVARVEKIYFTELGHVMARVYYPKKKCWVRYRLGNIEEMLSPNFEMKFTTLKENIYKKKILV